MRLRLGNIAAIATILLATGCAALPPLSPPWTPPAPSQRPAPLPSQEPEFLPPSAPPPVMAPSENNAVVALLQKSQSQSSAGQLDAASASLERALRIEPRNPELWQKLARVRLEQNDYQQAENLAAKSNALAGKDRRLRSENWRIIGEARSKRGDRAGAKAAFERAARE